jgi:hypothetical protein
MALALVMLVVGVRSAGGETNDFYDDERLVPLPVSALTVGGEVANGGTVDLGTLPRRSVVVKEAVLKSGKDTFVGAYRYEGYSLYDILNASTVKKANEKEFPRCVDLYVEVQGGAGDKAVFSWGEIYYPNHRHRIIVATAVAPIVPSVTKERWPLPTKAKIVAAGDLLSERNISDPVSLSVRSFPHSYEVKKGMKPLRSDRILIAGKGTEEDTLSASASDGKLRYSTVFYGRGRGIHGISTFEGVPLESALEPRIEPTDVNLRQGIFCVAAVDGYRCVYSLSEVCNRNDQAETLLVAVGKGKDGGRYKLFPAGDFFSDRAIKAIAEIRFLMVE